MSDTEPTGYSEPKPNGVNRRRFLQMAGAALLGAAIAEKPGVVEAAGAYKEISYPGYQETPTWLAIARPQEGVPSEKWDKIVNHKVTPGVTRSTVEDPNYTELFKQYPPQPAIIGNVLGEFPIPNEGVGWVTKGAAPGENNVVDIKDADGNVVGKDLQGRGNNTILVAHKTPGRGIDAPFQHLDQAQVGDTIWVARKDGQTLTYKVVSTEKLPNDTKRDKDGNILEMGAWEKYGQPTEETVLTLYGCEGPGIYNIIKDKRGRVIRTELVNRTHKRCVRAVPA